NDVPVDVVVRPEDIYIMNNLEAAQFTGKVKSCVFKGVHYEMFVDTADGYEVMVQDYNAFEPGSEVGLIIKPQDIQVMKKPFTSNIFEGTMLAEDKVEIFGGEFACKPHEGIAVGDKVEVEVAFNKVDLVDNAEDGVLEGFVSFILYKGNHYHLTVTVDNGAYIYVDTQDIWDKSDWVGVNIAPKDIQIRSLSASAAEVKTQGKDE
ncbi:MAG: TOBE domain-containing protein, partial [Bacteroidales bacterium]|nr:TOBE domain-containing protein [Bacteroidales bacterium]